MLLAAVAVSCVAYEPANRPIDSWEFPSPEERAQMFGARSGEILLLLTFSGGGTRAAAFAYGVLQGLAATEVEIDGAEARHGHPDISTYLGSKQGTTAKGRVSLEQPR